MYKNFKWLEKILVFFVVKRRTFYLCIYHDKRYNYIRQGLRGGVNENDKNKGI